MHELTLKEKTNSLFTQREKARTKIEEYKQEARGKKIDDFRLTNDLLELTKDIILSRGYNADFVVYDKLIREVKAIESLANGYIKQTLNYLAA